MLLLAPGLPSLQMSSLPVLFLQTKSAQYLPAAIRLSAFDLSD